MAEGISAVVLTLMSMFALVVDLSSTVAVFVILGSIVDVVVGFSEIWKLGISDGDIMLALDSIFRSTEFYITGDRSKVQERDITQ